jgi:hypothetical protein
MNLEQLIKSADTRLLEYKLQEAQAEYKRAQEWIEFETELILKIEAELDQRRAV